ncbi:MAG: YARHG domain-containing protein [Clostridia bacterium]|nr:YARHG domain-containing protein [Clostridia bacterium]
MLEGGERYYRQSELEDMSEYQLSILRNGMFALSGKRFSRNQAVIDFFEGCDWYTARYDEDEEVRERMNEYQQANLELIIQTEKDKGYR